MRNGFNDGAFLAYLAEIFGELGNRFFRDTLENILDFGHKFHHTSKGQLVYFLYNLIPGIELAEIAQFANDEILTNSLILEKRKISKSIGKSEAIQ